MNGLSNKLFGCQIKFALIVGLLVSLAWALPVEDEKTSLAVKDDAGNTAEIIEAAPVVEDGGSLGQLRFPPFSNNNGTGFFERFGEKFRNKRTTTTTTTTTTAAPSGK
ncbi:uncharacterized protein LOC119560290 [Drosophila subpulchrella]|uniref:uncharacterized protein LOC119560290 n=1 Tax=Drosophila subpulchrella TaxID=1486046 RepID=UPI0018A164D7|nr:uncharacterized protein LOC119560290 [Drosophila subpulchrella]